MSSNILFPIWVLAPQICLFCENVSNCTFLSCNLCLYILYFNLKCYKIKEKKTLKVDILLSSQWICHEMGPKSPKDCSDLAHLFLNSLIWKLETEWSRHSGSAKSSFSKFSVIWESLKTLDCWVSLPEFLT